jgi:hypothetical protein
LPRSGPRIALCEQIIGVPESIIVVTIRPLQRLEKLRHTQPGAMSAFAAAVAQA